MFNFCFKEYAEWSTIIQMSIIKTKVMQFTRFYPYSIFTMQRTFNEYRNTDVRILKIES